MAVSQVYVCSRASSHEVLFSDVCWHGTNRTIGILIFQDMWAIVVMAIQPNLADPQILGILQTFGMMILLLLGG